MHTLVLLLLVGVAAAGFAPLHKVNESVKDRYLIKFKDDLDVDNIVDDIQCRVQQQRLGHAKISHRYYRVVKGMAAELSEEALEYIRTLDEVEYVSENARTRATVTWGQDRIDQFDLPLDGYFTTDAAYRHRLQRAWHPLRWYYRRFILWSRQKSHHQRRESFRKSTL